MFVVDAAVLLQHPPPTVARVVGRLALLPRWCAGLRRVRFAPAPPAAGCVFTYTAVDVRLTLQAHTVDAGGASLAQQPAAAPASSAPMIHTAAGDGLTLTWTLSAEPQDRAEASAGAAVGEGGTHTRLRARVEVLVDPGHPLADVRASLCRTVARRVPADLERLRFLLERFEAGRL